MSNILFLTSQYMGAAGANGICTRNIVAELSKMGHDVSVLCYDDGSGTHEENVYTISVQQAKPNYLTKIFMACKSFFFTSIDKQREQRFKDMTISLCSEKSVDMVVCMFFPLETVSILKAVKERFPKVKTIIYELDSIGDGIFSASKFHYFAKLAYERWMENNYRYADKIVIMKSHELYWKQVWGQAHGDKLLIADIPVLLEPHLSRLEKTSGSPVSFLYSGLLNRKYRAPDHLLSVFDIYSKNESATFDFYSKGDCEGTIAFHAQSNPHIKQNGYVPTSVLNEAVAKADVLVSIGNRVSRSVPSKLITYFSYGKPVVHLSLQKDDVCVEYMEQYPLGLVLREWESVEDNACKLCDFITKTWGKKVEFSDVADALAMTSPLYSADLLNDVINNF